MKLINQIKENYSSEVMLLSVVCFLAGAILGILVSPVKKGIAIGSYNGCNNNVRNLKHCNMSSDDEDDNIN